MHVVAKASIRSLADLNGRRVAVDLPNGGTFVTAITIFERLGIKPVYAFIEQRVAYEKLKSGELDAVVAVQGSPSRAVSQVKGDNLHFVPIPYSGPLQSDYLPSVLKAEDYPSLIPPGGSVDTVAVPAILAAYNGPPKSERYGKVEHFVKIFFDRPKSLQQPPFHPKWKEVVLSAPLKEWTRFPAAQEWLDRIPPSLPTRTRSSMRSWPRRPVTAGGGGRHGVLPAIPEVEGKPVGSRALGLLAATIVAVCATGGPPRSDLFSRLRGIEVLISA